MEITPLTAISPLDGRYARKLGNLRPIFSEYGLIRFRVQIEIAWLITLSQQQEFKEIPSLSVETIHFLNDITEKFNESDAEHIKEIEKKTNHDVKAVEYFIKEKISQHEELSHLSEFIHFACTSEDINNLSYALMLKTTRQHVLLPIITDIMTTLTTFAHQYADLPMLSRTHGQAATPTTLGKEFANIVHRLRRQLEVFSTVPILGKINGAVGNYNAHVITYPQVDWISLSQQFVENLGLQWNAFTTQIEPHDYIAEYMHALARLNTIFFDLCRDMWSYISIGYFQQKMQEHETGSSTMPHKINPIDFENAEGNLGLANALLNYFAAKLPVSRWQRDLTDSTVLRNLGVGIGHTLIAYQSLQRGLHKVQVNKNQLQKDLDNNWEVLAEAIQTMMRRYGIERPYEKLKELTRGKQINSETLREFIDTLNLPNSEKDVLHSLSPETYIGLAAKLAKDI